MSAYDEVPYTDHAFADAHPDRLAVVARLSGWPAFDVARARVLDVGCGRGGHALPIAAQLPDARVVGLDASARQIDEAREIARACGLKNAVFHAARFEDAPLEDGAWDAVVCHGVASWIAPDARRALFARIARWLAPDGVAYVSFNALPGWYERLAARDFLRFAASARGLGVTRDAARAELAWLAERAPPDEARYAGALRAVGARLDETERAYLVHEHLAPEHHPMGVMDFLDEARAAGLAYLGDAIPASVAVELLGDEMRARAERLAPDAAQALVDFARNTAFRRALFVRAAAAPARGWRWPARLDARALEGLRVALAPGARARADGAQLDGPDGSVHVDDADARAALVALARAAPRSVGFAELAARLAEPARGALARELLDVYLATGALDVRAHEPRIARAPSARPRACPVARWHAEHGGAITSAWHHEVRLPEEETRVVLRLADGTRTADEIARDAGKSWGAASPEERAALVRASLELLARAALLVE